MNHILVSIKMLISKEIRLYQEIIEINLRESFLTNNPIYLIFKKIHFWIYSTRLTLILVTLI